MKTIEVTRRVILCYSCQGAPKDSSAEISYANRIAGPCLHMQMGPRATFAYVVNRGSNDVSAYSITSNEALTPVPGSPFPAGLGPLSVAVDPMAKFAYVANIDSNDISAYSIASNGR